MTVNTSITDLNAYVTRATADGRHADAAAALQEILDNTSTHFDTASVTVHAAAATSVLVSKTRSHAKGQ